MKRGGGGGWGGGLGGFGEGVLPHQLLWIPPSAHTLIHSMLGFSACLPLSLYLSSVPDKLSSFVDFAIKLRKVERHHENQNMDHGYRVCRFVGASLAAGCGKKASSEEQPAAAPAAAPASAPIDPATLPSSSAL